MSLIKLDTYLLGPEGETNTKSIGTIQDNIIKYKHDNIDTEIKLNYDNKSININRRTSDYTLELELKQNKKTNGSLVLQESKILILPVETINLEMKKNEINVKYKIEEIGEFVYKLKFEVE